MNREKEYDLAFSFAGEDRSYVEAVKEECEKIGIKVYYDEDRKIDQWGLSFIQEQRDVYAGYKTKYFVPFISEHYFKKAIPTDEFKSALTKSIEEDGYILPIKVDESDISSKYLHPHIQYLKATNYSPAELAQAFKEKLKGNITAEDVDNKLAEELQLPRIQITPRNYNPYKEAESLLEYIKRQFENNLVALKSEGYVTNIRMNNGEVIFRLLKESKPIFALNVFFSSMGDIMIGFNFNHQSMMANAQSQNGHIEPKYNTETGVAGYEIADGFLSNGAIVSKEEVVKFFWNKMREEIERQN